MRSDIQSDVTKKAVVVWFANDGPGIGQSITQLSGRQEWNDWPLCHYSGTLMAVQVL